MSERERFFREFTQREIDSERPESQRECCDIAARASVAYYGPEFYRGLSKDEWDAAVEGLESGLFGSAYDRADRTQQLIWSNMCEDALLAAIEEAET